MYRFRFNGTEHVNQYEELIKVFMQPAGYRICQDADAGTDGASAADFVYDCTEDKDALKRRMYADLAALTGKSPKWGILTGIRPVKLAGELRGGIKGKRVCREHGQTNDVGEILLRDYCLHESKARLTQEILDYQQEQIGRPKRGSLSVYIGIPFCPSRCLYCSFPSNRAEDSEIARYLSALHREIDFCGRMLQDSEDSEIESVYFGGGTPTTLTAKQLDALLEKTAEAFDLSALREYTVEVGRPDTITGGKIEVLLEHGVNRISINPQTMKQRTLDLIGRKHTVEDVYRAFETAMSCGMPTINTDLIAGLPEETHAEFMKSVREITGLGVDNITLHTLAVKRASRLKEMDETFHYRDELFREEMLVDAHEELRRSGFLPYYLYRQKHTSGNTENTGFCKEGKASVYNIRIMEEAQTILALGAGGISKVFYPDENRLERVANVSDYRIYIERIDEMIQRKRTGGIV